MTTPALGDIVHRQTSDGVNEFVVTEVYPTYSRERRLTPTEATLYLRGLTDGWRDAMEGKPRR